MRRTFTYEIEKEQGPVRIGDYLRKKGYSRKILIHLKKTEGGILKNGIPAFSSTVIEPGDILRVTLLEEEGSQKICPVAMDLDLIYEDEDILVVNKPSDMPIHPSINNHENTLANGVAAYYESRGIPFVYRCINRLDRDTTGLLIIAKNMLSASILADMLKNREIHREYLAIASGEVPPEGVIDAPIGRKEGSVIERCVDFEKGERAVTHFRRVAYKNGYSLVSLKLETGRTHQIRVHMKYLGNPLIGDFLYHPDYRLMNHQALHSYRLSFPHPVTGQFMEFMAEPPWDPDLF